MLRIGRISLMQQAALCLALGVMSAVAWLVEPLYHRHPGHFSLFSGLLIFGGLGTYLAAFFLGHDVRTGIESQRWPEPQIERFRAVFNTPWANGLYVSLPLASFFLFLNGMVSHRHVGGSAYGLLLFSQLLSQLAGARREKAQVSGGSIGWRKSAPISSDHWGEAG